MHLFPSGPISKFALNLSSLTLLSLLTHSSSHLMSLQLTCCPHCAWTRLPYFNFLEKQRFSLFFVTSIHGYCFVICRLSLFNVLDPSILETLQLEVFGILLCGSFLLIADFVLIADGGKLIGAINTDRLQAHDYFSCLCHCLVFLISFINCRHHSLESTPQYGWEGRVEVPLIIFAFVNSVTPQHTLPASLPACEPPASCTRLRQQRQM